MKKINKLHLLLWALALPFFISACSDTDDLPHINLKFDETGGVQHGGALYVQNGDSICINQITASLADSSAPVVITACDYYWDGLFVGPAFAPKFARKFYVYNQKSGSHTLSVKMLIAAQGYSLATYVTSFPVIVVDSETDLSAMSNDGTDLFNCKQ